MEHKTVRECVTRHEALMEKLLFGSDGPTEKRLGRKGRR
jgi:hypothetical protein